MMCINFVWETVRNIFLEKMSSWLMIFFSFLFQRSLKREHLIIKWILRVTHAYKDSSIDFADWIADGAILSR